MREGIIQDRHSAKAFVARMSSVLWYLSEENQLLLSHLSDSNDWSKQGSPQPFSSVIICYEVHVIKYLLIIVFVNYETNSSSAPPILYVASFERTNQHTWKIKLNKWYAYLLGKLSLVAQYLVAKLRIFNFSLMILLKITHKVSTGRLHIYKNTLLILFGRRVSHI